MKPFAVRRAVTAALAAVLLVSVAATPAGGQDDWRLPGLNGGALTADEAARGTTIIVLWAGWSPRCRDIVERSNRLVAKWSGRGRVVLVDFQEEPGEVAAFLAGKNPQAPVYLDVDGTFAKRYALANLPGLLLLRDGAVLYGGRLPDDPDSLIEDKLR